MGLLGSYWQACVGWAQTPLGTGGKHCGLTLSRMLPRLHSAPFSLRPVLPECRARIRGLWTQPLQPRPPGPPAGSDLSHLRPCFLHPVSKPCPHLPAATPVCPSALPVPSRLGSAPPGSSLVCVAPWAVGVGGGALWRGGQCGECLPSLSRSHVNCSPDHGPSLQTLQHVCHDVMRTRLCASPV